MSDATPTPPQDDKSLRSFLVTLLATSAALIVLALVIEVTLGAGLPS